MYTLIHTQTHTLTFRQTYCSHPNTLTTRSHSYFSFLLSQAHSHNSIFSSQWNFGWFWCCLVLLKMSSKKSQRKKIHWNSVRLKRISKWILYSLNPWDIEDICDFPYSCALMICYIYIYKYTSSSANGSFLEQCDGTFHVFENKCICTV